MNASPQFDNHKPHLVIVTNSIVAGSGVANAVRGQSQALCQYFDITIITAEGELDINSVSIYKVERPKLLWLRRFGHALREYGFCRRVARAISANI